MSIFADKDLLERATGCRTVSAQKQWLRKRDLTIIVNPSGHLLALRSQLEPYVCEDGVRSGDEIDRLLNARASRGKLRIARRAIGVYLLIKAGTIVYVGQTTNFLSRAASHVGNANFDFDVIEFVEVPESKLAHYEHELIARLCPKYNIMHNTFDTPLMPTQRP